VGPPAVAGLGAVVVNVIAWAVGCTWMVTVPVAWSSEASVTV